MADAFSVQHITGTGHPLASEKLGLVAAAMICGLDLKTLAQPLFTVDAEGKLEFSWAFDGEAHADFQGERLSLNEFAQRFQDRAWRESNGDHPLAYLGAFWELMMLLCQQLKDRAPAPKLTKLIEDGDQEHLHIAIISEEDSEEQRAAIMEAYNAAG